MTDASVAAPLATSTGDAVDAVAVIGDGALTAGLAFEALDHAGGAGENLIVVLNDNGMSISENVGALSKHLTTQGRTSAADAAGFFKTLGFEYEGPIDGHDLDALLPAIAHVKSRRGPRLLHVVTRKGKGYSRAEADPIKYHGVTAFDPSGGLPPSKPSEPTYTQVFGEWLCEMAAQDPRLVVITPAMREGSGLVEFARRFPDRYHDVGIAEEHAALFAAGLAARDLRPVCAIYSTFLQRAYDQLIHDVMLQNLPLVMFCRPNSWRDRLDQLALEHGVALNVAVEADSLSLQIVALMTALTLLPSLLLAMTAFTRIIIVLSLIPKIYYKSNLFST